VELGHDELERRDVLLRMDAHGDATAIVLYADDVVLLEDYSNVGAITGQGLVYRVIDDLVDEMMQAIDAGRADVHAGPLADRLEPLKHLDTIRRIGRLHNRPDGKGGRRDLSGALIWKEEKALAALSIRSILGTLDKVKALAGNEASAKKEGPSLWKTCSYNLNAL
jgi:hypothetical protein